MVFILTMVGSTGPYLLEFSCWSVVEFPVEVRGEKILEPFVRNVVFPSN